MTAGKRNKNLIEVNCRIFDSINDAVIIHDAETGELLDVNRKMCCMYGYTREEALEKGIIAVSLDEPPFTMEDALGWIAKANGGEPQIFEWKNKDKHGRLFWVEVSLNRAQIAGLVCILAIIRDINKRKEKEEALLKERQRLYSVLDGIPAIIYLQAPDYTVRFANRLAIERYGDYHVKKCYEGIQGIKGHCVSCATPGELEADTEQKKEYIWPDGRKFEIYNYPFGDIDGSPMVLKLGIDITERKKAEAYFQQLFENSPLGIVMLDNENRVFKINKGFEKIFQYTADEAAGKYIRDLIVPEQFAEEHLNAVAAYSGLDFSAEVIRKRRDGILVNVSVVGYPINIDGQKTGTYVIYTDISERKETEEKLKFLSMHDPLTGLHNRTYFEEQMVRKYKKPTGILVCDIDGLKLVNDTMGHDFGDIQLLAAAGILKKSFRDEDIVARVGGDEFAVLLPNCDEKMLENIRRRIKDAVILHNAANPALSLSMSIGYALAQNPSVKMTDLFKEADNNMNREKLHNSQSVRSAIVQALLKALEVRDYLTEGHAERLEDLVVRLGASIGLPERKITDLRLLAKFHDIGKVGIPDPILFKPGSLSPGEKAEMQKHSEIGHRIALSAPDLTHIADGILKHHEWWDGNGYPLGLKGEEIPLECRILSIADAYDAMTSDRPYRKALPADEAVKELKRFAGIQFDPHLVKKFTKDLDICNIKMKKAP
ncbi:MAG: PAS domain S-box protein [Bacillota bacterium]